MSTEESITKKKRIGLVVGIDEYEDKTIPTLHGAQNDANEIFRILTENGDFEENNKYLLLGEQATRINILSCISEVFRQANDCELALFYFSGHGFVDNKDDLFISTYDMVKKDPFINGIRVNDLKEEIYSSKDKDKALLILDCCYSGIATKGAKGNGGEINSKNVIAVQRKIIGETKIPTSTYGVGKITIASSEATKESWEKKDCLHNEDDKPHTHGTFSFHLIEGLSGKAANELGNVTLSSLLRYIGDKMSQQDSFYSMTESSNIEKIYLTKSQIIIEKTRKNILDDISLYIPLLNSDFPDFSDIQTVSEKLKILKEIDSENQFILDYETTVNNALRKFRLKLSSWFTTLENEIYTYMKIKIVPFQKILKDLDFLSSIDKLYKLDKLTMEGLKYFYREANINQSYTGRNDDQLQYLIDRFQNQTNSLKPKAGEE